MDHVCFASGFGGVVHAADMFADHLISAGNHTAIEIPALTERSVDLKELDAGLAYLTFKDAVIASFINDTGCHLFIDNNKFGTVGGKLSKEIGHQGVRNSAGAAGHV